MSNSYEALLKQIENVVDETTDFDFPFFASDKIKHEIITEKKLYIERKLRTLAGGLWLDESYQKELWDNAFEHTEKEFSSLSLKTRLNGFYLQELMHEYSNGLGKAIIAAIYEQKEEY